MIDNDHLLSPRMEHLYVWAEHISNLLQEKGIEVLNVSEKRASKATERVVSVTLSNDTKDRPRQIEFVGSYSTRRVMRIKLMRSVYVVTEETPMYDVETEVRASLKRLLDHLTERQLALNLTDPN